MDQILIDRRLNPPPFARISTGVAVRTFGTGEPLVLLHGGAGSWEHWVRNADALARDFRVLAIDQPSYGDSDALPWETPVADYLDLVTLTVREITAGAPRVHIAGFSFGGALSAEVAVRLGARTASLSMIGGAGFGRPEGRPFRLESRKRMAARLGREPTEREIWELQKENLGKLMIWDKGRIDDWAVDMQVRNVARSRFDSRRISWMEGTPDRIGRLTCPVAVFYGEHDASAIPPIAERIARCREARPDVETVVLPDCGHWAMYELPDAVNTLMTDFHRRAG